MEEAVACSIGGASALCWGGDEGRSLEPRDILLASLRLNKLPGGKPRIVSCSRRLAATLARIASISASSGDRISVKSGTWSGSMGVDDPSKGVRILRSSGRNW